MYVSFGSKVRPRTFMCVAMGSAVFILRSRLLLYSAGSGVFCRYGCKYSLVALVLVDVMVISST